MVGVSFSWFRDVFKPGMMANIPASFTRSIELAAVVSALTVVFSVAAALGFRRRFPGSGVLFYFAVASLVMPSLLVGFGIGSRLPGAGVADRPVHLGTRRAADLDAAVRPVCHVRGGEPLQPRLRGSGERPRRHVLAAAAPCHAADPAARHHRRGDGCVHAVLRRVCADHARHRPQQHAAAGNLRTDLECQLAGAVRHRHA